MGHKAGPAQRHSNGEHQNLSCEVQIGMHFMNPPVVTDMLEIVGGKATSAAVYERAQVLALHLNKTVCFSADRPVRPLLSVTAPARLKSRCMTCRSPQLHKT